MSPSSPRRFPPPWTVREVPEAFCVCDANGITVTYCVFDLEGGAHSTRMTREEAMRIANGIARLPDLIGALGDVIMK